MSARKFLIPEFGPFAGMRVITAGSLIAMPFAGTMLADFGAEVIHIERPGVGDSLRLLGPFCELEGRKVSAAWIQDARNRLSMTLELDLKLPEVREVFYGLIRESDVFMENLVWLDRLGIDDAALLEANPSLVIVHVSGYGREEFGGAPGVCGRASYDLAGQAFSGWLSGQGFPDRPPLIARPYLNDFVSAMSALFGTLAAYHSAQCTGRGQVVDVAQFEAMAQYMAGQYTDAALTGRVRGRSGNEAAGFQPYDVFRARDGLVALGAQGPRVYSRCLRAMGLDEARFGYVECAASDEAAASPAGRELDAAVRGWCAGRSCGEIIEALSAARVPCSKVNTPLDCLGDAHFAARGDWVEYVDQSSGAPVKAFGVAPKLSATPGGVWRGAPALGQDTEAVLRGILGFDGGRIAALREKGLI